MSFSLSGWLYFVSDLVNKEDMSERFLSPTKMCNKFALFCPKCASWELSIKFFLGALVLMLMLTKFVLIRRSCSGTILQLRYYIYTKYNANYAFFVLIYYTVEIVYKYGTKMNKCLDVNGHIVHNLKSGF